jgi:hypothetical protein
VTADNGKIVDTEEILKKAQIDMGPRKAREVIISSPRAGYAKRLSSRPRPIHLTRKQEQ